MADNIKAPSHYVDGREYEPKDVIRDWGLNFNLGSCVKYISRAGRKGDKLEDLKKAKQFLEFEIEELEKEEHKDDISMTCKEAAETDIEIERKTSWYTNGILGQWYCYQNIPNEYRTRVIDKIAQEVLDSQCDIEQNIPSDEVRAAVIDRIVERINNGELTSMDIPTGLYEESRRIRAAIAYSEYRKVAMQYLDIDQDIATTSTGNAITITFNIKED